MVRLPWLSITAERTSTEPTRALEPVSWQNVPVAVAVSTQRIGTQAAW